MSSGSITYVSYSIQTPSPDSMYLASSFNITDSVVSRTALVRRSSHRTFPSASLE